MNEDKLISRFKEIVQEKDWCENIYEDDDPYGEPLISFLNHGVVNEHVDYLHTVISHIPEHKTHAINHFLYARVAGLYIVKECTDYLEYANEVFFKHLDNDAFIHCVYDAILKHHDLSKLSYVEKYFDPEFVIGLEDYKQYIQSYLLHQSLEKDLENKTHDRKNKI